MAPVMTRRTSTALLVIDPYRDVVSADGKVWERLKSVYRDGVQRHNAVRLHPSAHRRQRVAPAAPEGAIMPPGNPHASRPPRSVEGCGARDTERAERGTDRSSHEEVRVLTATPHPIALAPDSLLALNPLHEAQNRLTFLMELAGS